MKHIEEGIEGQNRPKMGVFGVKRGKIEKILLKIKKHIKNYIIDL